MASLQKITPFLWFDHQAEEAMNFYVGIFPNSKIVSVKRYPDGPLEGPIKGMEGKVLTGVFELLGQRFMALDGGPMFRPNEAVSFLVQCDTQAEIDRYWNLLSAVPAAEQCGWLKDKYGFSWQITPDMSRWLKDPDPGRTKRAFDAMMQMKKIEIAELDRAVKAKD